MKKILRRSIMLLIAFVFAFSFVSCGNKEDNESTTGKDKNRPFVVGSPEFNGDFYVGWTNSSYDSAIRTLIWRFGLMAQTPEGEIVDSPIVAKKTVSDDLTKWTFTIAKNAKFHNGEALTASDVKFTYDFYMDADALGDTGGTSNLGDYVKAVTVDEKANTVTFDIKKVIYTLDADVFTYFLFPEETFKKGAEEEGITVQQYVKAHISNPIGYGPYKLVEYREAEYVKLEAFKDYLGQQPKIKNLIVKVVPSETELDQLLQGEIDMITAQVETEKIDAVKADPKFTYSNYYRHGGGTVILHCDFGPTQITEVRQAFAYVFNRPKVIELFLGEYGLASQGPYSKNQWMMYDDDEMDLLGTAAEGRFEKSLINYDILDSNGKFDEDANIAKAHELLDSAAKRTDGNYAKLTGNGKDGYLWEGEPLNIKITYTDFWSDTYNLVWNEEYVSKLGFKVSLTGLDWPVMYSHWTGNTNEARQYHAYVGGISYTIKSNPKIDYASKKVLPWGQASDNGPRFKGGSSYSPDEWDALLDTIESAHPLTGRNEYRKNWRKFVTVFNKEVPIIPVYSNNYHDLYTAELENFKTNALWDWALAIPDANWKN